MPQSGVTGVSSQLWPTSSDSKNALGRYLRHQKENVPEHLSSVCLLGWGRHRMPITKAIGPKLPSGLGAPSCEISSFSFSLNLGCTDQGHELKTLEGIAFTGDRLLKNLLTHHLLFLDVNYTTESLIFTSPAILVSNHKQRRQPNILPPKKWLIKYQLNAQEAWSLTRLAPVLCHVSQTCNMCTSSRKTHYSLHRTIPIE